MRTTINLFTALVYSFSGTTLSVSIQHTQARIELDTPIVRCLESLVTIEIFRISENNQSRFT